MKKVFCIFGLTACLALAMGGLAQAADDAAMFFKRACAGCHGQSGEKSPGGSEPIHGKKAADIQKMLHGYKDGTFGGKQKNTMMNVVKQLSEDNIKDLSGYIETLK